MTTPAGALIALGLLAIAGGLGLLWSGLRAQRAAARVEGIGTSPVAMLAAGEVRITGRVVPAGVTLTSRLRLRPAVYERGVVTRTGSRGVGETLHDDSRAIGFFVRDPSGEVRIFPRGASWEVPLDASTETAAGWDWRTAGAGLSFATDPGVDPLHPGRAGAPDFAMPMVVGAATTRGDGGALGYREARIGPGDLVTVVGRAVPFRDLADPTEADTATSLDTLTGAVDRNHLPDPAALDDPAVAASYREALAAGTLVDPVRAWGNAAIEGFGIGRPVRPPELDPDVPGAVAPPAAPAGEGAVSARVERDFEIGPDALVIAAGPGAPLLIAAGSPGEVVARNEAQFLRGLLGAALAVGGALLLALAVGGTFGPLQGG